MTAGLRTGNGSTLHLTSAAARLTVQGTSAAVLDAQTRHLAVSRGRVVLSPVGGTFVLAISPQMPSAGPGGGSFRSEDVGNQRIVCAKGSRIDLQANGDAFEARCLNGMMTLQTRDAPDQVFASATRITTIGVASKIENVDPSVLEGWQQEADDLEQPRQSLGPGQLIVDSQSGSRQRVHIARYHVNVVLRPPVALVQIDQTFYNPGSGQAEGTFVFNLPQGSSVSRFAMFVTPSHVTPQRLIEGELIERNRADQIYTSIVRRRRDPAILEQIGDNLFRMRVFPVFGRDFKRVLLDYTLPLVPEDKQYRFALPLLSDRDPIWQFKLTGSLSGPIDLKSLHSPSHPNMEYLFPRGNNSFQRVETKPDVGDEPGGRSEPSTATFEYAAEQYRPGGDFRLSFQPSSDPQPTHQSASFEPNPTQRSDDSDVKVASDVCHLFTIPSIAPGEPEDSRPVDLLLRADTSGSMRYRNQLNRIKQTANMIAASLSKQCRVQIACVDVSVRRLTDQWLSSADERLPTVLQKLNEQYALGESKHWLSQRLMSTTNTLSPACTQESELCMKFRPN